jgi:hypothetical protein
MPPLGLSQLRKLSRTRSELESSVTLPMFLEILANLCLLWQTLIIILCLLGYIRMYYGHRSVSNV